MMNATCSPMVREAGMDEWGVLVGSTARPGASNFPDACLAAEDEDGAIVGRVGLWWTRTPEYAGRKVGLIGHYAAENREVSDELLAQATGRLAAAGCGVAIGPMNGSTWGEYRFVTEGFEKGPFLFEPWNPPQWPGYFHDAGFRPVARYLSTEMGPPVTGDLRHRRVRDALDARGIRIRPIRADRVEEELRAIYRVVEVSFQSNFLYAPIGEAAFLAHSFAVGKRVSGQSVLLAEDRGGVIGFCLAMPDEASAVGAEPAWIVKTVAVLPGRPYAGLGMCLVAESHRIAAETGFRRVIHALMHESNPSRNIHAERSRVLRRYALFAKSLTAWAEERT